MDKGIALAKWCFWGFFWLVLLCYFAPIALPLIVIGLIVRFVIKFAAREFAKAQRRP